MESHPPRQFRKSLISLELNSARRCFSCSDRSRAGVRTNVLTPTVSTDRLLSSWPVMRFERDEKKNRQNLRKHDVRFETAILVFDDPFAISQRDLAHGDEERWITIGAMGPGSILLVVHTFYEQRDEEVVSIISARAADSHERKAYEEAHKGAETRYPSHHRKKGRGY